ncbi:gamma carbonic anhydrase family protein [Marinicellulosiphila megalodicopiae]|uniref:gamma carbonic anhydrase family protein n=1 Tax=Marinicellulosiphila megalodicopiae TaxID=2724896 RepID=UPI003BAF62A0
MNNENIQPFKQWSPKLGQRVMVAPQAFINGDVELGDDCSVWPMAVIRGDMHKIRIGNRVSIQDGAVLHITHQSDFNPEGHPLMIGDDVTIGHNACLHGCQIENEVLIGIGVTVLDGAKIPSQVVIGAGSLVPPGKQLESGFLYIGSPVKKTRELNDKEKSFFKYSAQNYVKLKDEYLKNL